MSWLGLDIGGANLKAADGRGWAAVVPFPLWRDPAGLTGALSVLLGGGPKCERLAVAMTGELCDCFRTKVEGVRQILAAVEQAGGKRQVWIYLVDGRLVPLEKAREEARLAAASNWHALARFACRFVNGRPAVLVDIGSTTTDIIPLIGGQVCPKAFNDTQRLVAGELVYTGVGRTPVCAITSWLPWRGMRCPVAAEVFATAADAYVVLEEVAEQPDATWTADGRALTKEFACERLARMVCADASTFDESDARPAAELIRGAQMKQLAGALGRVVSAMDAGPECAVICGSGEFLARRLVQDQATLTVISLSERLGAIAGAAGPAHALAVIAREAALAGELVSQA